MTAGKVKPGDTKKGNVRNHLRDILSAIAFWRSLMPVHEIIRIFGLAFV